MPFALSLWLWKPLVGSKSGFPGAPRQRGLSRAGAAPQGTAAAPSARPWAGGEAGHSDPQRWKGACPGAACSPCPLLPLAFRNVPRLVAAPLTHEERRAEVPALCPQGRLCTSRWGFQCQQTIARAGGAESSRRSPRPGHGEPRSRPQGGPAGRLPGPCPCLRDRAGWDRTSRAAPRTSRPPPWGQRRFCPEHPPAAEAGTPPQLQGPVKPFALWEPPAGFRGWEKRSPKSPVVPGLGATRSGQFGSPGGSPAYLRAFADILQLFLYRRSSLRTRLLCRDGCSAQAALQTDRHLAGSLISRPPDTGLLNN